MASTESQYENSWQKTALLSSQTFYENESTGFFVLFSKAEVLESIMIVTLILNVQGHLAY